MRYTKEQLTDVAPTWPQRTLVIMRGPSGSGKTTLAKHIQTVMKESHDRPARLSADFYFYDDDGEYVFNANDLQDAHFWCRREAQKLVEREEPCVIIDNTNMRREELAPYVRMAWLNGYVVRFVSTSWVGSGEEAERLAALNSHGVNRGVILRQMRNWAVIDESFPVTEMADIVDACRFADMFFKG